MRTVVGVVAVIALVSGCGSPPPASQPPPASGSPAATTAAPPSVPEPVGLARSEPVSVRIPRIAASSSLVPLGLNADQTIQVPPVSTPMQAGWYRYGPTPGELGPAVILGHVDGNKQPGIFYRLREMVAGDEVFVLRTDGGTIRFVVRAVERVPKDRFPTEAVYGDTDRPELRLITCGGAFDRAAHSYLDNIIVYAVLS